MFFWLATLRTWRNFSQTRLQKCPKIKENSETGYMISTKIQKQVEGEGILEAPPCQLLVK